MAHRSVRVLDNAGIVVKHIDRATAMGMVAAGVAVAAESSVTRSKLRCIRLVGRGTKLNKWVPCASGVPIVLDAETKIRTGPTVMQLF